MPLDKIAKIFVKGIEKRTYKQTLSFIGKFTNIAQRYFPALLELAMIKMHKRSNK